jgi:NAD(P)-dependent dehydrogenase (short-subunit alcohol dehydrogenase family)
MEKKVAINIRMNNVLPGFIDSYAIGEDIRAAIPMQRSGSVSEIAKTVAFLVSADSGYITGQNMRVDGGLGKSI